MKISTDLLGAEGGKMEMGIAMREQIKSGELNSIQSRMVFSGGRA